MFTLSFCESTFAEYHLLSKAWARMTRLRLPLFSLFLLMASPASAEILFVCGGAAATDAAFSGSSEFSRLMAPTRISTASGNAIPDGQIALSQDENGYDLVLNWGETNAQSLRDAGASITGTGFGTSLVHLVVARSETAPLEHFIFREDRNRLGELVWAQGPDSNTSSDAASLEHQAICVLP